MYLNNLAQQYARGEKITVLVKVGTTLTTKEYVDTHTGRTITQCNRMSIVRIVKFMHRLMYKPCIANHEIVDYHDRFACILVGSGSVALGKDSVSRFDKTRSIHRARAACIGQPILTDYCARVAKHVGISALHELLLMKRDFLGTRPRAGHLIQKSMQKGGLPFINEHDGACGNLEKYEYFNDNDRLSLEIAKNTPVDMVVFFTDRDGVCDGNNQPVPILTLDTIDHAITMCDDSKSSNGGMRSKLASAKALMAMGIPVLIGSPWSPACALALAHFYVPCGTLCIPDNYPV